MDRLGNSLKHDFEAPHSASAMVSAVVKDLCSALIRDANDYTLQYKGIGIDAIVDPDGED